MKLENYYLLTLLTSQGCWKRTRKEAEARGVEKYIQDLQHRFTFSENYYLLTRLSELLEQNKEESRIWKQKMEFETQKKMENYYLLTLFPGLLEQKKGKKQKHGGLKSISKMLNTGLLSLQKL